MAEEKPPYVCEPQDQSEGRPATYIFIHGYGDDAEGLPLGLAQQFQFYKKAPYIRWLLPNAPIHPEARTRAWYMPKALPNALKPRVPGQAEEDDSEPDDEAGILKTCDTIDDLVQAEIDRGVEPERIIVGGFSQGCAVSLVWGLVGKNRNKVGGCVCASGYFPLADRIEGIRTERGIGGVDKEKEKKQWLLQHGSKDILVPGRLFEQEKQALKKWVDSKDVFDRLYEGMGHSTCNAQLRDMLFWLGRVVPA